jgi:hypothetical protein
MKKSIFISRYPSIYLSITDFLGKPFLPVWVSQFVKFWKTWWVVLLFLVVATLSSKAQISIIPNGSIQEADAPFSQANHGFNWTGTSLYQIADEGVNAPQGYNPEFTCSDIDEKILSDFVTLSEAISTNTLTVRFPGGEVGNYWTNYNPSDACDAGNRGFGFSPSREIITQASVDNSDHLEDNNVIYDFIEWVHYMKNAHGIDVQVLFVANLIDHMFYDNNGTWTAHPPNLSPPATFSNPNNLAPEFVEHMNMNLDNVQLLLDKEVNVVGIEMGNELVDGRFASTGNGRVHLFGAVNGVGFSHYKEILIPYINEIEERKLADPTWLNLKIGAVMNKTAAVNGTSDGVRAIRAWIVDVMSIQTDIDGFIIHNYSNESENLNTQENNPDVAINYYNELEMNLQEYWTNFNDIAMANSLDPIKEDMTIWFTEWGPRTDLPLEELDPGNHENDFKSTAFNFLMQAKIASGLENLDIEFSNFQSLAARDFSAITINSEAGTAAATNWFYPFYLLKDLEGYTRVNGYVLDNCAEEDIVILPFRKLNDAQDKYTYKTVYVNFTNGEKDLDLSQSVIGNNGIIKYYPSFSDLRENLTFDLQIGVEPSDENNFGVFTETELNNKINLPAYSFGIITTELLESEASGCVSPNGIDDVSEYTFFT